MDLVDGGFMDDLIKSTLTIGAQAVTLIIVGVIAAWLGKVKQNVVNSHNTNMRDENDERHREVMDSLTTVKNDVTVLSGRVKTLEKHHEKRGLFR